jgi:hypothetical protein
VLAAASSSIVANTTMEFLYNKANLSGGEAVKIDAFNMQIRAILEMQTRVNETQQSNDGLENVRHKQTKRKFLDA